MVSADARGTAGRRTVVLLDNSASMKREDLWDQATRKLEAVLTRLRDQDGVAVVTFDRVPRLLMSFEEWATALPATRSETALQRLRDVQPAWTGTSLGAALLHGSELLNASPDSSRFDRELVLISDLQEGSHLEGLQGYEWPRGTEVLLEPVQAKKVENARADWIPGAEEGTGEDAERAVRLRVTNEEGAAREQFQLNWAGVPNPAQPTAAYVPAGQSRAITMELPPGAASGKLTLSGDEVDFDNTTYVVPLRPEQISLLFAGRDAEGDNTQSLFFLRRAFSETRRQKVEILVKPGDATIPVWELGQAQMVVLGDGVSEATVASARAFAENGRTVLLPLNSAESSATLLRLTGAPALKIAEAQVRDYAMFAQIDFQHPLFAPFADPRYSDFSKIRFWKYRKISGDLPQGTTVLAKFDSGDPALLQIAIGKGNVIVFASTWRPADSQLALSTKFVPLLYAMLGQSSGRLPRKEQYLTGESVPMNPGTQPWTVTSPGGAATTVQPSAQFDATTEPGIYSIAPGNETFAVNLPAEESRTRPMPTERLLALGVPARNPTAAAVSTTNDPQSRRVEDEARQKLWRWVIAAAVLFLLGETLLAGTFNRRNLPAAA
jgi:hypothetical protein